MERSAPVEGGGYRCDTLCCILNCSLELLCLILIIGTFFLPVFSVDVNAKNAPGTLGVCTIENPEYYDGANVGYNITSNTSKPASVYNRVYFGTAGSTDYAYDANIANQPIYWRVLSTHANNDSVTPALFMLTEYCITKNTPFDSNNGQTWKDSSLQTYLKNNILPNFFSTKEQSVIMETTKVMGESQKGEPSQDVDKEKWYNTGDFYMYGCKLEGDKLFPLSAKEAINKEYGFSDCKNNTNATYGCIYANDTNRQSRYYSTNSSEGAFWWLRSSYTDENYPISMVYPLGYSGSAKVTRTDTPIRFAVNIPLSSVLFATNATEGSTPLVTTSPSSIGSLTRTIMAYNPGDDTALPTVYQADGTTTIPLGNTPTSLPGAKLTILDESDARSHFTIPQRRYIGTTNSDITIPYRHAVTGQGEYITALIKNSNNEGILRYTLKALSNSVYENGTFTMTIPNLTPGNYLLIIMNEHCSDTHKTNYAKNYNMHMSVDSLGNVTIISAYTAGACDIHNPDYYDTGSEYNRVYFGKDEREHAQSTQNTRYFRVLNTTANDKLSTPALFMLTEYSLPPSQWHTSDKQIYNGSYIDTVLTNMASSDTSYFEDKEKAIILSTYNEEITEKLNDNLTISDKLYWFRSDNSDGDYYTYGCGLSGKKIFLLSAKEITTKEYGFDSTSHRYDYKISSWYRTYSDDINRCSRENPYLISNSNSWLRSACSNSLYIDYVACIETEGFSGSAEITNNTLVTRFALNIPLSKIIFAQDTEPSLHFINIPKLKRTRIIHPEGKSTTALPSLESAYDTNNNFAGAKLTIVDNDRSAFSVEDELIRCDKGGTIRIRYTGASIGPKEYISAIIKNSFGEPLYHARLKSVGTKQEDSSGEIIVTAPDTLDYGEYTLIVYNEEENGMYKTNYAGYDIKSLIISDITTPVVTNLYQNIAGTYLKFNASDNIELYKVTDTTGQSLLNLSGRNKTTNMSCQPQETIFVEDSSKNVTTIQTSTIPIDRTSPSVSISYGSGTYTLTVSDSESGIWKITNSSGNTIYRDYSTNNNSVTS